MNRKSVNPKLQAAGRRIARCQAAARIGISVEEYESQLANGFRWCGRCKQWKITASFSRDSTRPSGYAPKCKACLSGQCSAYWARIKKDPVKLEQKRKRERGTGRRSPRLGIKQLPRVPKQTRDTRLEEYEGLCAYCDATATTFDHIIPVSRGGTNHPANIAPACRTCNSSKQDKDLFKWVDDTGRNPKWQLWEQVANWLSLPA